MTKTLTALIAAALVGTAGFAAAQNASTPSNYFVSGGSFDTVSEPIVDLVIASGAGKVTLYDFNGKVQGRVLGTENVQAGANFDLFDDVTLGATPRNNVLAVLTIDGQIVATQEFMRAARR